MIHYFPLTLPLFLILAGLLVLLVVMVVLDAVSYVYIKMGVAPQYVFAVLFLALAGSYVNIPVMQFPHERVVTEQEVIFFGMRYVLPVVRDWPGTVLAVNLGGAVVPALTSLYLLLKKPALRAWNSGDRDRRRRLP